MLVASGTTSAQCASKAPSLAFSSTLQYLFKPTPRLLLDLAMLPPGLNTAQGRLCHVAWSLADVALQTGLGEISVKGSHQWLYKPLLAFASDGWGAGYWAWLKYTSLHVGRS